jgi:HlyD family secretion protein
MEVEAYVDETDISKVKIGQPAAVTVDAFPGRTYQGKVGKISPGSTIQEGVITYDVSIFIPNKDAKLRSDMTANVTIQTGNVKNALLVPAVAIQQTLQGAFVKVAKKTNGQTKISLVPVTTGGSDGVNIQILKGLTEGQQIVLAGGSPTPTTAASSSPLTAGGGGGRGR